MDKLMLPLGKLSPELLNKLLAQAPLDNSVLQGPGTGLDCAVVEVGKNLLVIKSDPITFVGEGIGWYAVQVNANDIATSGAIPHWFLVTLLLPDDKASYQMAEHIMKQVYAACEELEISVVGGHTEVTHSLNRPIISGTMIGEVNKENLITPNRAQENDALLLTKGIPIEATAILAQEFPEKLAPYLSNEQIARARQFLYQPGISVLKDARIAMDTGQVHAMHDPTEGGLCAALWELAVACGHDLNVDLSLVHIPSLAQQVLDCFVEPAIDPYSAIASGAMLMAVEASDEDAICASLEAEDIPCMHIGTVEQSSSNPSVWQITDLGRSPLPYPKQDAIAKLFAVS
jgi:hydrogenase maturation factor